MVSSTDGVVRAGGTEAGGTGATFGVAGADDASTAPAGDQVAATSDRVRASIARAASRRLWVNRPSDGSSDGCGTSCGTGGARWTATDLGVAATGEAVASGTPAIVDGTTSGGTAWPGPWRRGQPVARRRWRPVIRAIRRTHGGTANSSIMSPDCWHRGCPRPPRRAAGHPRPQCSHRDGTRQSSGKTAPTKHVGWDVGPSTSIARPTLSVVGDICAGFPVSAVFGGRRALVESKVGQVAGPPDKTANPIDRRPDIAYKGVPAADVVAGPSSLTRVSVRTKEAGTSRRRWHRW